MRLLVVLAAVAALAVDADAARKPTPREKAAVTLAVVMQVPQIEGVPALFLLKRVVVSTVRPGPGSTFSRFALAVGSARDQSGYPVGSRAALVGFHRRVPGWVVVDYAPRRVGCRKPQEFFGGRRAAILRDLGIRCR